MVKCQKCENEFALKKLAKAKGRCPSCGTAVPVGDYCTHIPDRSWWRLYSAAPIVLKVVVVLLCSVFVFLLTQQSLIVVEHYIDKGKCYVEWLSLLFCYLLFPVQAILLPVIFVAVRGSWIPYFCVFVLGLATAGVFYDSGGGLLILSCLIIMLCFIPQAIRWREQLNAEELAYSIAKNSGADVLSLKVRKYPLDATSIVLFLVIIAYVEYRAVLEVMHSVQYFDT